MFDEERFDGLARGLATNRLSRGQVLKSFAASLLLAGPLGALRNRAVSAQQPATGTAAPCADDPVTSASLGAAGSALAAGATQVKLSPKGCVRYRRTLKGGSVTSEEVTLEGKTALVWKHTSTKSTGRRDADLDGFFEWRSKVQRGAVTKKDDRTVTTEYSAATKKLTRRETYTRGTGKGWRVLIQETDQSGTLRTTAKFNTGPYVAAASRDQGSAGDFPQRPSEYSAGVQNAKPGVSGLKTIGCRGDQTKRLKARLRDSRNALIKCLQAYGAGDLAVLAIINYYARPIVITCASPSSGLIKPGDAAGVGPDSATMEDWTVRITVKDSFFQANSQAEQIATLGHEMLHLNGGTFLHDDKECNVACQKDPVSGPHHDRTYACEDLCFGTKPTKCSCDLCLGTPPGQTGQNCNERCKSLATCPYPAAEERCTFDTQPGTGGSGTPQNPCAGNQKYTQTCHFSDGTVGCCTPGSICCDPPGPQATHGCPGGGCCGDPAKTYCCNGCCCLK